MAVKSVTFKIGADTSDFVKGLKQADKAITSTDRQSKELQKGLKLEFDESRFVASQKLAQQALTQTEEKAKAIREQLKYLETTGGIDTDSYNKLQTELVKTENKAVILKNQLKEIDKIKYDNAAKGLTNLSAGLTKAGNSAKALSIAATAALAGIVKLGVDAVATGDEIQTTADQYNLSAEAIQKWNYIALQTDAPVEQLYKGITKVRDAVGTALVGDTNTATDALNAMGLTITELGNSDEAFYKVVTALSEVEDTTMRAYYANEIFGERVATELIPLLNQGGNALAELSDEFESVGYLSNEQVRSLADFDNELNIMKTQLSLAKTELGIAFLPILQDLSDLLTDKIIPAIEYFTTWFGNLSDGTKEAIIVILALTAALAPMLLIGSKLVSGIKVLLPLLSTLSAHPIIAIIGLVAVLLTTLYAKNEKFRGSVNKLFSVLSKSLEPVLSLIADLFNDVMSLIGPLIDALAGPLATAFEAISVILKPIADLIGYIIDGISWLLNAGLTILGKGWLWGTDTGTTETTPTSTTSDISGSSANTTVVNTNAGTTENTSSVDNSTTINYITIEANEYMNTDELIEAVSKKLTLKLQARS